MYITVFFEFKFPELFPAIIMATKTPPKKQLFLLLRVEILYWSWNLCVCVILKKALNIKQNLNYKNTERKLKMFSHHTVTHLSPQTPPQRPERNKTWGKRNVMHQRIKRKKTQMHLQCWFHPGSCQNFLIARIYSNSKWCSSKKGRYIRKLECVTIIYFSGLSKMHVTCLVLRSPMAVWIIVNLP